MFMQHSLASLAFSIVNHNAIALVTFVILHYVDVMQVNAGTKGGGPRSLAFCRALAHGKLALCATVL